MKTKQPVISLPSSFHIVFLFYSLAIVLSFSSISTSYVGNDTDHQALLKIKYMITQDPYGALTSWNTSFHVCEWSGVSCGKHHKRVVSLQLESLGLKGSLSPHVGNLSFLRVLSLNNNSFQGAIPHELGRLFRLRSLSLAANNFSGVIPSNLSRCSKLEKLMLFENKLVGGIPPFLGNITSVRIFSVVGNPLGGSIPDTLGRWKNLTGFYSGSCNLIGTIPHSLYNLSLLKEFAVFDNQLTGSLPPAIGAMLPHLLRLYLWGNQFTGVLPASISNCSRLIGLAIEKNKFSGKLTIDFAKLRDIYSIYLNDNLFGSKEADEMKFIDSLKNCSSLKILRVQNCKFQGVLPRSIGNLSHQLRFLDISRNQLYGNFPLSIGNLVGLTSLNLGFNQFTGNIPSTIGKLRNLEQLFLYANHFSGPIPDAVGNLSLLSKLSLPLNMLDGLIPSSIGNCHHLSEVYLFDNKLNGKIPTQLFQLSSLSNYLDLSQNNLSGSLPFEVGDLKTLTYLNLSDNNLSGNIPSSLGGCVGLSYLSLKGNLFQGVIPPSLSSLRSLAQLDLSHNNISGEIPRFLERFSVEFMDLSFNDFEGEVPMLGVFANASAFSILGNSKLCGGIVELGLPKCKKTERHTKKFPLFIIVILIVSALLTIICLAYAWCNKKTKSQTSQASTRERFLKVSYNQLLKATNGFSKSNLIGSGGFSSVYKGILDDKDGFVAIKVLHLQNRGAQRSFIRECEAWRSIRHRNSLKIITSCSSIDFLGNDFKALVYEFMPNGNLHDRLHSIASTFRLNLFQKINILSDVACALDYIHNHCLTTLVHGDLKPSNILLDEDMVAHIGDFGLARFLGTISNQNSSTGMRGTIGYAAPEYGLGSEMTCSGDVYSFGILLLEVMIGKRPTDDIFNEGLSLHKFASMALPNHVTDVIDADILNFYQEDEITKKHAKKIEECLASTVKIGVSCSMESPQERMNIKKVVDELHHIWDRLHNI